jgi:hypothetical protein
MAVKIQIRRGPVVHEGILDVGEPALNTETNKVFIGTDLPVLPSGTTNLEILTDISRQVIQSQLDGKAPTVHTHTKNQITDFEHTHTKNDITDFFHTHLPEDVTGLQDALDLKFNIEDFETHTHTKSDITDLESDLDSKADSDHNHTLDSLANVTITSISQGDVLKWDGNAWTNQADNFGGEGGSESDPTVASHIKAIETTDIIKWDTAYAYSEVGHLTSVSESDVTQHQAALSITESQISNLQPYLTSSSTLPGSQITSTGVEAGKVLIADGSGGSAFQNPFEWQFVQKVQYTADNNFTYDLNTNVLDFSNYDVKFILDMETDGEETSGVQINIGRTAAEDLGEYKILYNALRRNESTDIYENAVVYSDNIGNVFPGISLSSDTTGATRTKGFVEFTVHEFDRLLTPTFTYFVKGTAFYTASAQAIFTPSVYPEYSTFTGTVENPSFSFTRLRVTHGFNNGNNKIVLKVYRRLK